MARSVSSRPAGISAASPVAISGIAARRKKSPTTAARYQWFTSRTLSMIVFAIPTPVLAAINNTPMVSAVRPRCRINCRCANRPSTPSSGRSTATTHRDKGLRRAGNKRTIPSSTTTAELTELRIGNQPTMQPPRTVEPAAMTSKPASVVHTLVASISPDGTTRMASDGESRLARRAGRKAPTSEIPRPNNAPTANGENVSSGGGIVICSKRPVPLASTCAPRTPVTPPITVPTKPIKRPSRSTSSRTWRRVVPIARRIPNWRRRSPTFI